MTSIQVTADDIRDATPRNCTSCPVAQALKRYFKTEDVIVGAGKKVWAGPHMYHIDKDTILWIAKYDAGMPVSPFTFTLTGEIY
jgi:hypothetical protein